jgi:hypothetical protein
MELAQIAATNGNYTGTQQARVKRRNSSQQRVYVPHGDSPSLFSISRRGNVSCLAKVRTFDNPDWLPCSTYAPTTEQHYSTALLFNSFTIAYDK